MSKECVAGSALLSEAFAFLGNSLLSSMGRSSSIGLDPGFWDEFPSFGCAGVEDAARELARFAREDGATAQSVDVEYAKLFVGPPKPAAMPWESSYRGNERTVGFGQAAHEMRALLRENKLALSGESNQYADHMGIELLLLAELLRRGDASAAAAFAASHPSVWIDDLRAAVDATCPNGYYSRLLALVSELLAAVGTCQ